MRTRSVKFCLVSFFIDIELYYTSSCFQLFALAFFPSFFAAVVSSLCFTLASNVLRTISKMALKHTLHSCCQNHIKSDIVYRASSQGLTILGLYSGLETTQTICLGDNQIGPENIYLFIRSLKTCKQDISFQKVFPSLTSAPNGAQLVVVEGLRGDENQ